MNINPITAYIREVLPPKPVGSTRLLIVSDVHLGHRRVKTEYIVDNFTSHILNPTMLASIDAILVTGDFFDSLLNLPTPAMRPIHKFIRTFLKRCAEYKVAIRILEGTPGHDWGQSKTFIDINEEYGFGADVMYVSGMDIIEDKTLGLTIGYVQDEYSETVEKTTKEMEELLTTRGFSQIDLMLMHGQFDFQVPKGVSGVFDSEIWSKWVRYAIYIGHNHTHRSGLNIRVPGSFERLAHNEEGPKGFMISDIVNGRIQHHFIENSRAMLFRTVGDAEMSDIDIIRKAEVALDEIWKREDCLRQGFLKIKHNPEYDLSAKVKEWRAEYPDCVIESENAKIKHEEDEISVDDKFSLDDVVINISRENVADMVLGELADKDLDTSEVNMEIQHILAGMKI